MKLFNAFLLPKFSALHIFIFFLPLASPALALAPPAISSPDAVGDFGERAAGETVEHTFTLQNTGGGLLRIHNVRVSCGCTASNLSARELPGGESATLTVKLDLTGRSGPQTHHITVHSNDRNQPPLTLTLKGEAVPRIQVTPRTLNFQRIQASAPPTGVIRIEATGDNTVNITGVGSTQDRVDLALTTLEENKTYELKVTPRELEGQGHFSDVLEIKTSDEKEPLIRAIVMWQIQPPISIAPSQLSLVIPRTPVAVNRFLLVRGGQELEAPLEITGVTWADRDIDVQISAAGEGVWRIEMRGFVPDMSMNREEIIIHTNAPGHETLRVPVRTVRQ